MSQGPGFQYPPAGVGAPAYQPVSPSDLPQHVPNLPAPPPTLASAIESLRGGYHQVVDNVQAVLAQQKPWVQFGNPGAFSKPLSFADSANRLQTNLHYFWINYEVLACGIVALSLLWNPSGLIALGVLGAGWVYLMFFKNDAEPIVIGGQTMSRGQLLGAWAIITFVVAFFITGLGSRIITAAVFAALAVGSHGVFRGVSDLPQTGNPSLPILADAAATAYAPQLVSHPPTGASPGVPYPAVQASQVPGGYQTFGTPGGTVPAYPPPQGVGYPAGGQAYPVAPSGYAPIGLGGAK